MDGGARIGTAWRRLAAFAAASLCALLAAGTAGSTQAGSCDSGRVRCLTVEVPVDRSGRVAGRIRLHVEVLHAKGFERGVMFLLAGGPGQGSAGLFELADRDVADYYRSLFPGYSLVAFDARGTGRSGPLRCPMVKITFPDDPKKLAACARLLGAKRDFYGTADHAEDLDAVRIALGYPKIAIAGVSYGTQFALGYALAHPSNVERLLLDSVVPLGGEDPFLANMLSRMGTTLGRYCAVGACRGITSNFAADVAAVANQLAAKPLRGNVLERSGKRHVEKLDGLRFLSFVVDADLNPGLAAGLPAVVHAYRTGNAQPLRRMFELLAETESELYGDLNVALYVATTCRDGPFPWQPKTPVAMRASFVRSALNALPRSALGPFGPWAARAGSASSCLVWPPPAGGARTGSGPLPNVPVLALSGDLDLRTPTADAAAVVARFPQGHLLVVPGVGHSVLTGDFSGCADDAVRSWMAGGPVPRRCPRGKPFIAPVAAYAAAGSPVPGRRADPKRTLELAAKTLREAEATWLLTISTTERRLTIPGLRGGTLEVSPDAFTLTDYSIEPGVTLTGRILLNEYDTPLTFSGTLTVRGAAASGGMLAVAGTRLGGLLGGKFVG